MTDPVVHRPSSQSTTLAQHRLLGFGIISLALHSVAAAFWLPSNIDRCCATHGGVLEVALTSAAPTLAAHAHDPAVRVTNDNNGSSTPTAAPSTSNESPSPDPISAETSLDDSPTVPTSTLASSTDSESNALKKRIALELGRYFTYPPQARRRGWESTVLIALTVHPDGRLNDLVLTGHSGYAILDRAALAALRQVQQVPVGLNDRPVAITLPIVYRLTD